MGLAAAAALSLAMSAAPARAEIVAKSGTFSGCRVVLTKGYDPAKTYPVMLALAGGGQEMRIVENGLKRLFDQIEEAARTCK
jgi:hypothetical protein